MVQKHEMNANFEQLNYDKQMLQNSWNDQLIFFESYARHGMVDKGMIDFIKWILTTDNSKRYFAGSSMWNLLISKPQNGKLNYQQTLKIKFDNQNSLYQMEYSDWDTIDKEDDYKKAVKWKKKCTGIELTKNFLKFLEWNKNWC